MFLHLLFAVFAVGPLVHAATTASRGVRRGDRAATAGAARVLRAYAYASLLVVGLGFGLMSQKDPHHPGRTIGAFGQTWIWLSVLLWLVAVAIVLAVLAPTLGRAARMLAAQQPATGLVSRLAAGGGVVALLFAAVVALMVYQPGR